MSKEEIKEKPDGTLEQGDFKIKKKPKKLANKKKEELVKVNLAKKKEDIPKVDFKRQEEDAIQEKQKQVENAISESQTGNVDEKTSTGSMEKVEEQARDVSSTTTTNQVNEIKEKIAIIEEIKVDEKSTKEVVAKVKEEIKENPKLELPENVEKLVDFMKDTGGTLEDYVKLNKDYSDTDNEDLLVEYYLQTKPHLNHEEINFLLDDKFAWDEDVDEERAVKKKQLALKEEIAKAKNFLEETKSKYYDEIKLRPGVTQDQQKATDFFNRYNTEQELRQKQHADFQTNTNNFFSNEFKGFDFKLGEKQFRYKVNDPNGVANSQSDLNNFIGKFLDKDGKIKDLEGYHKALYSARNADTIAQHFYEQGKTDAIKDVTARSKNITNDVRPTESGEVFINGMRVKAINGVDSSKLKIKKRKTT